MKALTKLVVASFLALSAVAPALAAEENTLLERNTYTAHENAQVVRPNRVLPAHRAVDAFASAPANTIIETRDFSIGSQR